MLFSDDATYVVDAADRKICCFRRKGELFNQDMVLEKTNRGYGSVNVWGGIIGYDKTPLIHLQGRVTLETYISDVLPFSLNKFYFDAR